MAAYFDSFFHFVCEMSENTNFSELKFMFSTAMFCNFTMIWKIDKEASNPHS